MTHEILKNRVVGVDIGLEHTTVAIVDVRGNVLAKEGFPTGTNPNVGEFVSVLSDTIMQLMSSVGGSENVRSIGVCCHSANYMTGCVENAANLPWKGIVPMAAMLRDRLGMAVALGNNAHARALGEHAYGAAHGMENFILLTLGGGVGSCIFSNGRPHLGRDGFAGEVGHTCAKVGGRQCGCGNKGCLEVYTSSKAMLTTARELMAETDMPSKLRQVEKLTFPVLAAFCQQGDPLAVEVVTRCAEMLGIGLANYASVVNPEAIIFTGSVTAAGDRLLDVAKESFDAHVFCNASGKVKFLMSEFEESEANLLGASVLAWNVKEYSLFK
ncbi:MAG: ROK family protein [Prevotella sp.]|nr:ROK family protein [Prevotella sp.]